jgi:hypothetical protein
MHAKMLRPSAILSCRTSNSPIPAPAIPRRLSISTDIPLAPANPAKHIDAVLVASNPRYGTVEVGGFGRCGKDFFVQDVGDGAGCDHAGNYDKEIEGLLSAAGGFFAHIEIGPTDVAIVVEGRYLLPRGAFGGAIGRRVLGCVCS